MTTTHHSAEEAPTDLSQTGNLVDRIRVEGGLLIGLAAIVTTEAGIVSLSTGDRKAIAAGGLIAALQALPATRYL